MSQDLWKRARGVFEEAIGKAGADREAYLADRCGDDSELLRAVETLLEADSATAHPLDAPPVEELAAIVSEQRDRSWIGRELGPYRILEKIGAGGMGTVFLAERADEEFEKRVAIKMLRGDWVEREGLERFRRERQILARLEHPHIARLLDGGTTDEGLPYLVMEHVEGTPIHEHCQCERLTVRQRVELLEKVCGAVRYAHQNLIVHRDLKAGNVLVTRDGEPKLLDFGIAKLLVEDPHAASSSTRILTPSYASPEQAAGGAVTTASDVYSLGVLLYELLTGRRPIAWDSASAAEIERRLREVTPDAPSRAVAAEVPSFDPHEIAAGRSCSPAALRKQLAGDLDTITLKALRKEPQNRYASAEALGEDLGRFLRGLPIAARPASLAYRVSKFVRRHRIAVLTSCAAVLALLALTVSTWVSAKRIAEERDLARSEQLTTQRVVDFLVGTFEWANPETALGREYSAREIVDFGAQNVRDSLKDEPEVRARLLSTLASVYRGLGAYEQASALNLERLDLEREGLAGAPPELARAWRQRAEIQYLLGDYETAREAAVETLELQRDPASPEARAARHLLGRITTSQDGSREAEEIHRSTLAQFEASDTPPDEIYRDGLRGLAQALRRLSEFDEAARTLHRAIEIQTRLHPGNHPVTASLLRDLASTQRASGQFDAALVNAQRALDMTRTLYGEEHPATAESYDALGNLYRRAGRFEEGRQALLTAIALKRQVLQEGHPRLTASLNNLATLLVHDLDDPDSAEPLVVEALRYSIERLGERSHRVGVVRVLYADLLTGLGRGREAVSQAREALAIFTDRSRDPTQDWNIAMAESTLGNALAKTGDSASARQLLDRAQAVLDATRGPDYLLSVRCAQRRLALAERIGDSAAAGEIRIRLGQIVASGG